MSKQTWRDTYYPTPAYLHGKHDDPDSKEAAVAAIRHSLRKWEGLRPDVLKAHGTTRLELHMTGGDRCSLCYLATARRRVAVLSLGSDICAYCPLTQAGQPPCDEPESAYREQQDTHDPQPMIAALRAALEHHTR